LGTKDSAGTAGTGLTADATWTAGTTTKTRATDAALPAEPAVTASAHDEPTRTTGTPGAALTTGAATCPRDNGVSTRGARPTGATGTAMAHKEPAGTTDATSTTSRTGDNC
jgi:hypothetical protein